MSLWTLKNERTKQKKNLVIDWLFPFNSWYVLPQQQKAKHWQIEIEVMIERSNFVQTREKNLHRNFILIFCFIVSKCKVVQSWNPFMRQINGKKKWLRNIFVNPFGPKILYSNILIFNFSFAFFFSFNLIGLRRHSI